MTDYYFGGKKVSQSEYASKTIAKYTSSTYKSDQLKKKGITDTYEGVDVTGYQDKRSRSDAVSDLSATSSTLPPEIQQQIAQQQAQQTSQGYNPLTSPVNRLTASQYFQQQTATPQPQSRPGISGMQMLTAGGLSSYDIGSRVSTWKANQPAIDQRTGRPYGYVGAAPQPQGVFEKLRAYSNKQQYASNKKMGFTGALSAKALGAGAIVGAGELIRHPIRSISSMVTTPARIGYEVVTNKGGSETALAIKAQAKANPSGFTGELLGQGAVLYGFGKLGITPKYETIELPKAAQKFSKLQGLTEGEIKAGQVEFHHTDYVKATGKKLTIGEHQLWHEIDTGKVKASTPELKKFFEKNKITAQPETSYTAYKGLTFGGRPAVGLFEGKFGIGTKSIKLPEGRYGADVFQSKAQTRILQKSLGEQFPRTAQQFKDIRAAPSMLEFGRTNFKAKTLPKPEFFSKEQAQVVLDWGKKTGSPVRQYYGSSAQYAQTPTTIWEKYLGKGTLPKDYDIQLNIGTEAAKPHIQSLVKKLQKTPGYPVRLSKENPLLIESNVKGEWHHGADIHSTDMPAAQADIFSSGEYAFGLKQSQRSTKIGGLPSQRLSEQFVRKFSSISTLEVKGKEVKLYPEAHRVKDIGGYFAAGEQLAKSKWFGKQKALATLEKAKGYYGKELAQLSKSNEPIVLDVYSPKKPSAPSSGKISPFMMLPGVKGSIPSTGRSPTSRTSPSSASIPKLPEIKSFGSASVSPSKPSTGKGYLGYYKLPSPRRSARSSISPSRGKSPGSPSVPKSISPYIPSPGSPPPPSPGSPPSAPGSISPYVPSPGSPWQYSPYVPSPGKGWRYIPISTPPTIGGAGFGAKRGGRGGKQKKGYTPTARAAFVGLYGKSLKGSLTGLEERYAPKGFGRIKGKALVAMPTLSAKKKKKGLRFI